MNQHLTPERFLHSVRNHQLHVVRDDGVYRHLRFHKPDSSDMHFEIVTWPGYLAYVGDMGAFTFTRLRDMLEFFRRDPAHLFRIDMRYWAEKCEAEGARGDGLREWDPDAFKREITKQRRKLLVRYGRDWTSEQREDFWNDLQFVIDANEQEHTAITAMQEWFYVNPIGRGHIHISTDDFPSCKTYTERFRWCCYALAWGISKYDERPRDTTIAA